MNRGALRVLAGLLASVAVVAGCTDQAVGPDARASGDPLVASSVSPSPSDTPAFLPDDDVLRVAIKEPATLDPMRIQDPGSVLIARQLYEGLTRWDPVEEEVMPAAAETWDVENGGRRFVFHLRQGMTFHDGSPVTSTDFAFALDRIAQKRNASDLAYTLDMIEGFDLVNVAGDATHLSGVRTPDDLTLEISLQAPYQDFPAILTNPGLVPLPKAAVEDLDSFLAFPIGNGPFQMIEPWAVGQELFLRAFPGFIETPDLDGLHFVPYPDAAASWLPFLNGELDAVEVPSGRLEAAAEVFGDAGFKPFLAGYYFGLNVKAGSLGDVRVRRAINRAIDRETIASTIYKDTMIPPRGIVPAGVPGFVEDICTDLCDYAPEVAAGIVDGLSEKKTKLTIEYTAGEPHARIAKAVAADLEEAGFDVSIRSYPFARYLRLLQDGDQEMYRLGWIAESPVADVFLSALFGSDSPDNHSSFKDARVDALLAQAHGEPSPGRREQLYKDAEREILRAVPLVPIGSFVTHWAAKPSVVDIRFDVMGGFDAVSISLSEESPNE